MRFRFLLALLLTLATLRPAAARDDEEGVPVRIEVIDERGAPIPNAWVRVPDTEGRRIVDPETGIWEARFLYRYDGDEFFFERGMTLEFTISAPGYSTRVARYKIRGGKNHLTVTLPVLATESVEEPTDVSWFRKKQQQPEPRPAPNGGPDGR